MEEARVSKTVWDRVTSHFGALRRDRENGLLLGVCAGLAKAYGLNPLGIRVVAVLGLLFLTVPTAITYLVLGVSLRDAPLTYFGRQREAAFWRSDGSQRDSYNDCGAHQ